MRDLQVKLAAPEAVAEFAHMPECGISRVSARGKLSLPDKRAGYWLLGAVSGALSVQGDSGPLLLGNSMAVGFPAESPMVLEAVTDSEVLYARLVGCAADRLFTETLSCGCFFPHGGQILCAFVYPLLQRYESTGQCAGIDAGALAFSLLTQLYRKSVPLPEPAYGSEIVYHAVRIMQEEFATLYGIEEIADRLEISSAYFIRLFSQNVGTTPGRYLTGIKIAFSKKLLGDNDLTVGMVADLAGFSSISYFGKVFRRATGMSPSEYARIAPKTEQAELSALYV